MPDSFVDEELRLPGSLSECNEWPQPRYLKNREVRFAGSGGTFVLRDLTGGGGGCGRFSLTRTAYTSKRAGEGAR